MIRPLLAGAAVALSGAVQPAPADAQQPAVDRPNIVHILIDDLGYADLGCYGGPLADTPHLDRLAAQGMRFTSAYAASPICSPARAALLTGRSPARLQFEFVTKAEDEHFDWNERWMKQWADYPLMPPPYTKNLPLEERTFGELLRDAGYHTGMTGKWHVAAHHKAYLGWSPTHGPAQQGFEWTAETFGSHPYGYPRSERGKFEPYETGQFPPDELTQRAIEFIRQPHDRPFFLFVSHCYVHDPLDTRCRWLLEKYRAKAEPGTSDQRILYAAFVETMDHYVGQLLDALDEAGLADNTMIVMTSDNGGHPVFAFNRPLRGSKWNLYEGGVRVPLIVRWPGKVQPGATCDVPVTGMDLLPTFGQIAGAPPDPGVELDGRSILPLLEGQQPASLADRTLTWHFPYYHFRKGTRHDAPVGIEDGYISLTRPQSSIRRGRHKLIYFHEDQRVELYDLAADLSEQHDRSGEDPELAAELKRALLDELAAVDARFPRENPMYRPAAVRGSVEEASARR